MDRGICMKNIGEEIRGFLIDVEEGRVGDVKFENNINNMLSLTKAEYIKISEIMVAGKRYKIIRCEKQDRNMKWSCMNVNGECAVRGSCLITSFVGNSDGLSLASLTDEDVDLLMNSIGLMLITSGKTKYNTYCLCNVEIVD